MTKDIEALYQNIYAQKREPPFAAIHDLLNIPDPSEYGAFVGEIEGGWNDRLAQRPGVRAPRKVRRIVIVSNDGHEKRLLC